MDMKLLRIKIMELAAEVDDMRAKEGRSERGRKLSILFTELEKVYAFAKHIDALDDIEEKGGETTPSAGSSG